MAMDKDEIIKELLKDVDFKKLTPEQVTCSRTPAARPPHARSLC